MYEKFNKLLQDNGITAYHVSKETGIAQTTFSEWKRGKSQPKLDKLQKIADFFDIPITYFTEDNESVECEPCKTYLTTEEKEILNLYDQLSEEKKEILIKLLKLL